MADSSQIGHPARYHPVLSSSRHKELAEREGFEPPVRFPVLQFSRLAPSTTRPPLRRYTFSDFPILRQESRRRLRLFIQAFSETRNYFVPFGYTKILLASPVFSRAMAFEKSFIGMRSVITG